MMKTEKRRILVVDDRESDTRLLKLQLEVSGLFEVREENDPQAAVFTAEQFKPDLILLDLVMPTMDGRQLAAYLEASKLLKTVPIVFLTARVTKEEVDAVGGRIGGFPFLAKPVAVAELISCIQQHLR
ncbi:MAG TPA: response regulator [Verrucomicrobiae bacterium]|nr:response regulator [Verrucomicrobiae bacterium]